MFDIQDKKEPKHKKGILVRVGNEAHTFIKERAARRNISMQTYILRALEAYIKREERYK